MSLHPKGHKRSKADLQRNTPLDMAALRPLPLHVKRREDFQAGKMTKEEFRAKNAAGRLARAFQTRKVRGFGDEKLHPQAVTKMPKPVKARLLSALGDDEKLAKAALIAGVGVEAHTDAYEKALRGISKATALHLVGVAASRVRAVLTQVLAVEEGEVDIDRAGLKAAVDALDKGNLEAHLAIYVKALTFARGAK